MSSARYIKERTIKAIKGEGMPMLEDMFLTWVEETQFNNPESVNSLQKKLSERCISDFNYLISFSNELELARAKTPKSVVSGEQKSKSLHHLRGSETSSNGASERGVVSVDFPEDTLIQVAKKIVTQLKQNPVSPLKLYTNYTNYTKYIDFDYKYDNLILLIWSLGTFCFEIFDYYPIIKINAPKSSGKTKVCTLTSLTTRFGTLTQNVSSSWLFRMIERRKPTLVIDDMEILADKEKGEDINSVLRAGWYRGGMVGRCNKNTLDPEEYNVYCPKIVSNIKGLNDDALESRTIPISLIRSKDKDILNIDITPLGNDDTNLAWALNALFAGENAIRIKEVYNSLEPVEGLNGRDWQMWKSLLSIARVVDEVDGSLFDGDCFSVLSSVARDKVKKTSDADMESFDMKVLLVLKDIVQLEKHYTIDDIKQNLDFDANPRSIGYALSRLQLDAGKVRRRDGMFYLLSPVLVNDRFERYSK